MHFGFTEEQELLRKTARDFLERECPMRAVREIAAEPAGHDPGLWRRMAELGWLGLLVPEAYGGADLDFVSLVPVLEELGRALVPCPFHGHLQGTLAVLRAGSPSQRKEHLTAAAAGERILTLAVAEADGGGHAADVALRAERDGADYRLHGEKLFVPDGQNADAIVVVAREKSGLALALAARDAPGLSVTPMESVDPTRRIAELRFDGAPAEPLGETGAADALAWVRDRALVALAADAAGGADRVLEASVAYAKERVQFDRPIGANQAIKHRVADMLVEVEAAKALTYFAAWAAAEDRPELATAAAMAKARASDAYRRVAADNIQIHGGVGFTAEYDCHLYFKRAKAIEVTGGDPTEHRERIAQLLL